MGQLVVIIFMQTYMATISSSCFDAITSIPDDSSTNIENQRDGCFRTEKLIATCLQGSTPIEYSKPDKQALRKRVKLIWVEGVGLLHWKIHSES